ncbi:MAG TPA: pyrroline-5-carboxylate reductase [Acidimicrobiales bacterium]|nr:pyrroline-5-carboxylate reductase [Acidimicrobiales bacterium]
MTRLVVVGGGRMGNALVGGLLRSGWIAPGEITIAERRPDTRRELEERFPGVEIAGTPVEAESAVLAVKPQDAPPACKAMGGYGIRRVVSIVAGVRIADLEADLGPAVAVLRAMPNMPAVVGASASALAGGTTASEEDFAWAEAVLSSFGVVARVAEPLLDAVTGLSGSGPAYVLMLVEALVEAGVGQGLDREVSRLLTHQTLLGTARLLTELGDPAEELRARVTSPGGTTAAGVRELERAGFRSALMEAVDAAASRARELGRQGH